MTTVRRSKAMPTDGPTAKFLYTIIKQLDLKSIDWNLVASQLEISNGHAARMRYSRFRQQMEGITSTPRSSRPKKTSAKTSKGAASKAELQKDVSPPQPPVKQENPDPAYERNPYIKTDPYAQEIPNLADIPHVSSQMMHPQPVQPQMVPYPPLTMAPGTLTMYAPVPTFPPSPPLAFHQQPGLNTWAPIKAEPQPEPRTEGRVDRVDVPVKAEPSQEQ